MKKLSFLMALLMLASTLLMACGTPEVEPDDTTANVPTDENTQGESEETTEPAEEESTVVEVVADGDFSCSFVLAQQPNEQKFSVQWNTEETLKSLEIKVTHGEQTVATKTVEGEALEADVVVDAYYGKHTVALKATNDADQTCEITANVALWASEYVIAPISGSMPQLYFTLYMDKITNDHKLPAFVWLARPGSWNWDNLPENVYPMPTVDVSEVLTHNNYDRMVEVTDAYIEELFSIHASSKFNLYINDFNSYLYMKLMAGNGISEENYYVTLLSDGGASNSAFNAIFNKDTEGFDADPVYADMAAKLATLYTEVREAKDYNWTDTFTVDTTTFNSYAYVCAKEMDNVEWWLPRPRGGVLCSTDEEFINTVLNVDTVKDTAEGFVERAEGNAIIERNFANPLTSLDEEGTAALKALYNFSDDMFEAADKAGKKAMMILGSWANASNEPDFDSYVKLVKAYYGDEFVYFYKGHPNTPTALYPDKQAQLERLDLIDVESSINAELILFFYPDIYMCGYSSSTFTSVYSEEMACALFNVGKDAAYADEGYQAYRELIGFYATKLENTADSAYAELLTAGDHTYFLMEFNRDDKPADIAIFDETANTIAYYNVVDGNFVAVTK